MSKHKKNIAIYHDPEEINEKSITLANNIDFTSNDSIDEDIVQLWDSLQHKPKLLVFDLDLTLWPFWIDTHVSAPFKKSIESNGNFTILDDDNKVMTYFSDVPKILNTLRRCSAKSNGYMAVASRTAFREEAIQLLSLYEWIDHFDSLQMFSGSKVRHINRICTELGIKDKKEILFFDDDNRNIIDTVSLGVTACLLDMSWGLTKDSCIKGLKMYERKFR